MAARARRSGWIALGVTLLARTTLGILASLLLWAVLPIVVGSKPTVVMTGSMLPRLVPGDVVVSRPVPAADLQLGQTLLFHDPDQPGHLRLHRWVEVATDGRLITKGDANPGNDSTPIDRDAVVGVASLRIPFVARPVVWANDGRTDLLALAAAGLVALVVAACWFRAADVDADTDAEPPADHDASGEDPAADPRGTDRTDADAGPRRLVRAGAALFVAVGLLAASTATAHAATAQFTRVTSTPTVGWAGATYFSCGGAARATAARFSLPLGESGGTTAQDVTANDLDGSYSGGVTYGTPGPCRLDGTTGVTLNGSTGAVSTGVSANSANLTYQVWFKAVPGSRGGTLLSFTDGGFLGLFPSTNFAVGISTAGGLTFSFVQGGSRYVISAPADLRDNGWHQVTAVAGSAGMALYVDGVSVASNYGVPVATTSVAGTARVGYGIASNLGTSSWNSFTGSVAFATLWPTSLPADTIAATYRAAA